MGKTRDRVEYALQEARILVIGSQLLIGLLFRSTFETGFERLPHVTQVLLLSSLGLMLVALAVLQTSAAFHRIAERGEDTERLRKLVGSLLRTVLVCFALGLGITGFAAGEKILGRSGGLLTGLLATLVAVFLWYGWPEAHRKRIVLGIGEKEMEREEEQDQGTPLKEKIKHVLTETRVVLPGAQALLGFQFVSMLTDAFEKLPASSKYIHLASLLLVGLSTILLMIPLPLGVVGDFYVVALKVTKSGALAGTVAIVLLALFYGLWFAFPLSKMRKG